MSQKVIALLLCVMCFQAVKAQSPEAVYNSYTNFNLAKLQGQYEQALGMGKKILPNAEKLSAKTRTMFYYAIGNLYENFNHPSEALACYEKVAVAEPNYFVAQRALGYLYLKQANELGVKLNASKKDINENKRLTLLYTSTVKKALPYLEKAQACDPEDRTLSLIKMLHKNIKDEQGLNTLDARLQAQSKNCLDILTDK